MDALAGRYRELPGSDPAAMSRVLAAAEPTTPTSSTPAAQATPPSAPLIAPAAPRARSYPLFPGASGQPLPRAERRWYGWQTLIGLSVTDAMILGGSFGKSSELIWAGAVGRALVPPIVHFAHGHELKGAASLLLNAGVPLAAGLAFGTALGEDPLHDSNFFLTGFYLGFVFSGPIAAAIDVAALSTEEVSVSPKATTLWPRSLMLTPIIGNGRAGLAVGGLL